MLVSIRHSVFQSTNALLLETFRLEIDVLAMRFRSRCIIITYACHFGPTRFPFSCDKQLSFILSVTITITVSQCTQRRSRDTWVRIFSTVEGSATEETTEAAPAKEPLPPPTEDELKSETGADFMPLANALMAGEFKEADQLTRDLLIFIAGPGARSRKYVYFTEVVNIPSTDLRNMERLWLKYSEGKFGYTVQKRIFDVTAKGDFETFCDKIDWNLMDNSDLKNPLKRKRRWFGNDEFIYELDAAPKGHLPLTSALRGTMLLKELMKHPVWSEEEFKNSGKGKYDKKK